MLRKCAPDIIGPDKWRGPAESDLDMRIHHHKCSFCGLPMSPYKDYGNALIWKCDNNYCVNNPDCKLKADYDFTGVDFQVMGNPNLRFQPWDVHRVC
jgi:hypothetical protein